MRRRVGARTFIAVISLGSVAVTLAVQAVSPGLPELQRVLDLSDTQLGWFTTAYVLPGVILTVPLGILGDAVGKRVLYCLALSVYGTAALVESATTSYPLLLSMRVVQGTCFAAAMPLTITLIGEAFSGHQRIRALAGRNATLTGSEVVLPIAGGLLAAMSWRAPLFVQAIAIPLAIYSFMILPDEEGHSRGKRRYARELFRVLRTQPGMIAALLTGFSRFLFKYVMYAWLPILLVNEGGASLTQVGIVISASSLVAVLTSTRVPGAIQRIPPSAAVIFSLLVISVAIAAFTQVTHWGWALLVGALYGLGDGVLAVLIDTYAIHTARSHVRAGMVSVNQTARNVGKFVSPLVMTAIVAVYSVEVAFLVMAVIGVLMVPLMLPLRTMDRELQSPDFSADAETAEATARGTESYE
jgi:MFS family permease